MNTHLRNAFTLVELMVAMVVAAVLASAVLVALYGAQEEARDARTRSQVAKLSEIVVKHWETYPTRNVGISYSNGFTPKPRERALARLLALRDLMRMEMPERITDLIDASTNPPTAAIATTFDWNNGSSRLSSEPLLFRNYIRRINLACLNPNESYPDYPDMTPNVSKWSTNYQGAECLYLIVASLRDEESSGLDFFRDSEVGDIDGDGMRELHDGWGQPISFLRWAPGFPSAIQAVETDGQNPNVSRPNRTIQPDHLDLLKVDPAWGLDTSNTNIPAPWSARANDPLLPGYLLFPLVYSGGPDEDYGIITDRPNNPLVYQTQTRLKVDPYDILTTDANGDPVYVGSPQAPDSFGEDHYADNITNHFIEVR